MKVSRSFLDRLSLRDIQYLPLLFLLFSLHFAPPMVQHTHAASEATTPQSKLQTSPPLSAQQASLQKNAVPPSSLRIGYVPNKGEFHRTYNAELYLQKLFHILSKYIPNTATLVPVNIGRHSNMRVFNEYKINIVALFGKTPERMFNLKYSKNPITSSDVYLVTNKENKIFYNDIRTLNGKTVAVYLGNNQSVNLLDEYLVKNNISMRYQVYNSTFGLKNCISL